MLLGETFETLAELVAANNPSPEQRELERWETVENLDEED